MQRYIIYILSILSFPFFGNCQNTIGLPDIINYSKQDYHGGLQSWDITQDKNGIVYIANNEGLLSFDGKYWNNYPLPNKTIVRSVKIGNNNTIYVGGQDEIGYFSPSQNGRLCYHSLTDLIPLKDKSFGDVWDIVAIKNAVFFRSATKIFKLSNNAFESFKATKEWSYLGECNGNLYAHDYKTGLMVFENNGWEPVQLKNTLATNDPVTAILAISTDSLLITSLKNGIYIYSKSGLNKVESSNNQIFSNERIYAATKINNSWIALATNNGGCYIIDTKGAVIQTFSKKEGLQNNNILSIFLDNSSNLWLGLDNGIDLIAYNSSIKSINPLLQDGSGYTAIVYNNLLFAGTSNGLYSVSLSQLNDLSFSKGNFSKVSNTNGQTWGLTEINKKLLLSHHEGAFVIENNEAKSISNNIGFWNFVPLSSSHPSPQIVGGNYKGLFLFDYENENFKETGQIPVLTESSRFVAIDKQENIWVSHPYHGVYKIVKNADATYKTHQYSDKNGLPSALNNHVYKIKGEVVVATEKGIYNYNSEKDSFEPSEYYYKLLGNQSIRYLKEDLTGNIWFIHEKTLGVIDFSGKVPAIIYLPELQNKMLSGFEFIYPVNENNLLLGSERGFLHLNYQKYKQNKTDLAVQIRAVRIISSTDSLLFGGYFKDINEQQIQDAEQIQKVANSWKSIRFEYSSPIFGLQSNLEYSYRLKGFDDNWSEWTTRTEKEYTNLPAGNLSFEVKVRNNLGNESAVATYSFKMLPPWYLTIWAKLLYLVLLLSAANFLYRLQKKKFRNQQIRHEAEQKRLHYIHDLEISKAENELVNLKNEKLEADLNFKNSELASSAMHLVKKGELLAKIKGELTGIMKGLDNTTASADLKKLIRALSEDDNMDKEWDNFSKHFDKVHSDFLVELKAKHPGITPNELKLSAYLRMNLSTKEIAQLMNISVRGVEISRYRLRKKLELPTETSLFDYLIGVQGKG